MTTDTRIALFLMGELVAALMASNLNHLKRWLSGGMQDLGGQRWKSYCWTDLTPSYPWKSRTGCWVGTWG
ncbi:hypothetical protein KR52_07735 [Synechococcus sp. KORDI-52]|uniref:hypothetical protein n=1 Tax=Synechococcus sp. KORDI-52 TaxID=585425 RepID=UPI0004E041C8|nr:hypothetical protein [Synechococcus sp. KORDI-52]AII49031.1 hypothetical protein KR52_07735 [Synechococcus sp. KORDI-52]